VAAAFLGFLDDFGNPGGGLSYIIKISGKISPCGFPADEERSFSRTSHLALAEPKN